MKIIPFFKRTILRTNLQHHSNKNRAALHGLSALGFPLRAIRKALVDLNEIKLHEITEDKITKSTLSMTIRGQRFGERPKTAIAKKLGLEIEELFPR